MIHTYQVKNFNNKTRGESKLEIQVFKRALIRSLQSQFNNSFTPFGEEEAPTDNQRIISILKKSQFQFDETSLFTKIERNTFSTFLQVSVNSDDLEFVKTYHGAIRSIANELYGKQEDQLLMDVRFNLSSSDNEIVDFDNLSKINNMVNETIEDADNSMVQGDYDHAFDRIHTAIHAYFRNLLENFDIEFDRGDNILKLYKVIQREILNRTDNSSSKKRVEQILRSANGIIQALNEIRNNNSFAHPNDQIILKDEAKLALEIAKSLVDYLQEVITQDYI